MNGRNERETERSDFRTMTGSKSEYRNDQTGRAAANCGDKL